jgi:hypothetical protein
VLAGILARSGADLSAHATIERELEEANSVEWLIAEFKTIAEFAQSGYWVQVLTSVGMSEDQLVGVTRSAAWAAYCCRGRGRGIRRRRGGNARGAHRSA